MGERIAGPYAVGSNGTSNGCTVSLVSVAGDQEASGVQLTKGAACEICIRWTSLKAGKTTGNGTIQVATGSSPAAVTTKATIANVPQGEYTLDVTEYLRSGDNYIRFTALDINGNSDSVTAYVNVLSISISSYFRQFSIWDGTVDFTYIPIGSGEKTVHFLMDGREVDTDTTSRTNEQLSYQFAAQSHGVHTISCYFTVVLNGQEVRSNTLTYSILCTRSGNHTPIIATDFNLTTAEQYTNLTIPFLVYTPDQETTPITISVNGAVVSEQEVAAVSQTYLYRAANTGNLTITIATQNATGSNTRKSLSLTVTESAFHAEAVTDHLALYLNAAGRSNNEPAASRCVWVSEPSGGSRVEATLSGFDFASNGWIHDSQGNDILRVSGKASVTIPFAPFANDARRNGKTIEIEFATTAVMDYDDVILSCLDGAGNGISVTAQKATLTASGVELYSQYKEDEHIRIAFVIEKEEEGTRLVIPYINGVMSTPVRYASGSGFSGADSITIGSPKCAIDLYCIRVYHNNLTRRQVLDNWIADTQDLALLMDRYSRNNIQDEAGLIALNKLPASLPYFIISCPALPTTKDTIPADCQFVDAADSSRSYTAQGMEIGCQGTSSMAYPRKNYKIKFKQSGFLLSDGSTVAEFGLREGAIPTKTFCLKADFASSEGANNVVLVRLYNDVCPYKTPPQKTNSAIRQGIDGFPILMFWQQTDSSGAPMGDPVFIGKYNYNNDKGTEEVYGFAEGDESWEVKNNTINFSLFKDADFEKMGKDANGDPTEQEAWLDAFEGRYPDGNEDPQNLKTLSQWLVSTDRNPVDASGNAVVLSADEQAARLAKFRTELPQYMELDAVIFYYLFTELFLMVDSRAKNAFFTAFLSQNGKWFSLPYDFDTANGINNEGKLVFGYELEDIDHVAGGRRQCFQRAGFSFVGQSARRLRRGNQGHVPEITPRRNADV